MYRYVLLRVRGQPLSEVIATFGIGLAILELFQYMGLVGYEYSLPVLIDRSIVFGNIVVDMQRILITAVAVLLMAGLWAFTHYTKIGLAFPELPRTSARRSHSASIRTGSACSVFSGLRACGPGRCPHHPAGSISPSDGYDVLIKALAVCIIGGLGSTGGVIVASVLIGFAERLTDTYISSSWTMIVSLAAMLVVLLAQPRACSAGRRNSKKGSDCWNGAWSE